MDAPVSHEVVVEVKKLSFAYGEKIALRNLSLNFNAGQITAVMGRNGAGKSTLFKSIVGFHSSTSGSVTVLGDDPMKLQGRARLSRIGYIPQEPSDLLIHASVEKECSASDRDNGLAQGSTFEFLARLTPTICPTSHPRDLSEGQRLSLVLAIIVCSAPDVLIMDEPTDGLDPNQKYDVRQLILQMAKDKAIIISTHILEEVDAVCSDAIIIAEGKIVASGKPKELSKKNSKHNSVFVKLHKMQVDSLLNEILQLKNVDKVNIDSKNSVTILSKNGKSIQN
jgi:energy-coupling factor transport system ATP-binding protein